MNGSASLSEVRWRRSSGGTDQPVKNGDQAKKSGVVEREKNREIRGK